MNPIRFALLFALLSPLVEDDEPSEPEAAADLLPGADNASTRTPTPLCFET